MGVATRGEVEATRAPEESKRKRNGGSAGEQPFFLQRHLPPALLLLLLFLAVVVVSLPHTHTHTYST